MEKFKQIKGFEDYEISNYGRVYSHKTNKILVNVIDKGGYYYLTLRKNGKTYRKSVHRLVAEAFIPNPNNLPQVNHKDENPANNHVENLEWCDAKYNNNYGKHNEKVGKSNTISLKWKKKSEEHKRKISESNRNHQNMSKHVVGVDKDGNVVLEFASTREAGRNGFNSGNISTCCRNCYKREGNRFFKGYYWFFKKDLLEIKNASPHKREYA